VHDGIEMGKFGILTATMITNVLNNTAKAMAKMMGETYAVAQYPLQ